MSNSTYCPVPPAIMTASQNELDRVQLEILEGTIPEDLHGHIFMVAPVGSVNSGGLPYPNGDPLLNGDGMIYRFDFDRPGEVWVKTRIAKTPCYWADLATNSQPEYQNYHFANHGIARFSLDLGMRNQLNTAFLTMKFGQESLDRLLVTYDAGRPYEIDTESLEIITPIGSNQEWQGELDKLKIPCLFDATKFPFKSILSTAHPAFDFVKGEMFTVNYGRSFGNLLESIFWIYLLAKPLKFLDKILLHFAGRWCQILPKLSQCFTAFFGKELTNFTYLIRWDGQNEIERWKLILPDGSPVRIEQTIHQIGASKDYIVLMDTAFVMGVTQLLNNPFPNDKEAEEELRRLLERPANPDSFIYLVPRAALTNGQRVIEEDPEVKVVVQKVKIPLEAAHFLVDYDNPDGKVTLHVAHLCAMQVAEWLRIYDVSVYNNQGVPKHLLGLEHNATDIGRLGRYIIDGETGEIVESQIISDTKRTWAIDLYAFLDQLPNGAPVGKLENIYWSSFGLWQELLTDFIVDLYKPYKYRLIPLSEVKRLAEVGQPASLLHLHTPTMTIVDRFDFPCGYMTLSPQFIPRGDGTSDTNGYLVCTACYEDQNEIWIFEASNLGQGPICRLGSPSLKFGFTLHTAWLPQIGPRQATYNIPVRDDFEYLVKQNDEEVQKLFNEEIYPHFAIDPSP